MVDIKVNLVVTVKEKISPASESVSSTFFIFSAIKNKKVIDFVNNL